MLTGARRSIILFAVACCGLLAQDAWALSTEVNLKPTRDPETGAPTASLSVVGSDVDGGCIRIEVVAQTRTHGAPTAVQRVASVRVKQQKNKGRVTLRFRHLPTNSSGKTEKVNLQVYCFNSEGVKTVSENNAETLNKCEGARVVRRLAVKASKIKPVVIY